MKKALSLLLCFVMLAATLASCVDLENEDKGATIPIYLSGEVRTLAAQSKECSNAINEVIGELDAMKVRSCYPLSKKGCETLAVSYSDEYSLPVKIGRLSYIFGPGMKEGDSKIVAVFPKCIADGKDSVMKSRGEQLRSYTYVTDAITALLTILLDGENGQAYNIASKKCITTIAGIAHTLVEAFPEKGLKVVFDLPTEQEAKGFSLIENAVLDSKKLEALGWEPEIYLKDGLVRVVEEQIELKG